MGVILFLRNMIPHHQNAVNMAKNLLISGEVDCVLEGPVEEGDVVSTACLLDPIVRSIINTQNSQIQAMQGLLEQFGVPETHDCVVVSGAAAVNIVGFAAQALVAAVATVGLVVGMN